MKKIINGKMYNTETAKSCGEHWNGYGANDFNYLSEDLYLKKTGEFFLHGQGGALSKYSRSFGNSTEGGEKITPLTYEDAREWAEEYLTAEEYENTFGEIVENEGEVAMHVAIPKALYNKIGQERLQNGRHMKDVVVEALCEYFHTKCD